MLDLVIMLAALLLGLTGAHAWVVFVPAVLLTIAGWKTDQTISAQFSRLGPVRVLTLGLTVSAASNLLFSAICFYFGRGVAWLSGF